MDWIKQNKFLTGWLAVTLVGAAVLGFLFMSAKGQYSETQDAYTAKVSELQTMQNAQPFPDEENFKKMQELQKAHETAIGELHKDLFAAQIKDEPMTAVRFQDLLRETVTTVSTEAAAAKLKLPDKFYMGFDPYQATPPKDEAAAPLGRMLRAMALTMKELTNSGAIELLDLKRENLPEEGVEKATATPAPPGAKPDKDKDKGSDLVKKHQFDITFIASEQSFHKFLNALVQSKTQFFVPKSVVIENEKLIGPPKVAANTGAAPPPAAKGTPGVEGEAISYVVGDERLKVAMRIEVVDVANPAAKTEK